MKRAVLLLFIIMTLLSCETTRPHDFEYRGQITPGRWLRHLSVKINEAGRTSSSEIQIYFPRNYKKGGNYRTVIALHQYNNNKRDWELNTSVESLADKYNIVIVCPDMKKSVYETKYYKETTYKWNIVPGGKFIGENLINYLNNTFGLAYKKSSTGIMGATVGAHGAVLVAATYNDKFGAVAGISGYYDPSPMTNSGMITAVYGPYSKNKERWNNEDNPLKLVRNLEGIPVYLYHGSKNDAFNENQSALLAIRLGQLSRQSDEYSITFNKSKNGYYGWTYWKRDVPAIMDFFDRNLKK